MSRRCATSGKGPMVGNNVSHGKQNKKKDFTKHQKQLELHLKMEPQLS